MTKSTAVDCAVTVGGKGLKGEDVHDILVESDLDQVDHAVVTLANHSTKHSEAVKEGDNIEIKLGFVGGGAQCSVFKGEVTGIEPIYDSRAPQRVLIRALNQLHRLTRGKRSITYMKVTDKDIVEKLCQRYGLSASFGDTPPTTQYDHVYQDNLTDFEFLKMRAARIGYEVRVEDKTLNFRKRVDADSGIKLEFGLSGESALERFLPRLSTAHQVSEVHVFGWDPEKKAQILGVAKAQSSKLGDKTGAEVTKVTHGRILEVQAESPVSSQEDADNLAKSILNERLMNFITGDAVCRGAPNLKPGLVIELKAGDKRFDGKYYVTAVRHRYVHAGTTGGFRTEFKFRRDAKTEAT